MKFLCGNCKAKYRIDDSKIVGRALRMKCRKCGDEIVIREGSGTSGLEPEDLRSGSSVSEHPAHVGVAKKEGLAGPAGSVTSSRLGAPTRPGVAKSLGKAGTNPGMGSERSKLEGNLRQQLVSGAPADASASLDQWHAAVNDVPVGPMKRDELARKVAMGSVTPESLVWREGFDDWRPLKEVPELAGLLRKPPPPPSSGLRPSPVSSKPVTGVSRAGGSRAPAFKPGVPSRGPAGPSGAPSDAMLSARASVVPIGGRMGAGAAPALEEAPLFGDVESEATRVQNESADAFSVPPAAPESKPPSHRPGPSMSIPLPLVSPTSSRPDQRISGPPSEVPPAPARRGVPDLPVGAWALIVGAGAFGIALAVVVGTKLISPPPQAVAPTEPKVQETKPQAVDPKVQAPTANTPKEDVVKPTKEASSGGKRGGKKTGAGGKAVATGGGATGSQLSDEQRALLARAGGDLSGGPSKLRVSGLSGDEGTGSGEGLDASQLRNVVTKNRPALQRCYEAAIRGASKAEAVRMDVNLTIGAGGNVVKVSAKGADYGNMGDCLERSVKRWRFPRSGNTTETSFPVVFQPGA